MPTVFFEAVHRRTCGVRRGTAHHRQEQLLGGGGDEDDGAYTFLDAARPQDVPEAARRVLSGSSSSPLAERFEALARRLEQSAVAAGAERADVLFRETLRAIAVGRAEAPALDARQVCQLEVRCHAGAGAQAQTTLVELAFASFSALEAQLPQIEVRLATRAADVRARLQAVAAPTDALPIVIPPGADAGVLFHELCGHPLEGDVVARGASYLARRLGQRVAPEWVVLVDDPTSGPDTAGYSVDDEGTPAAAATLLAAGVVHEPLLDLRSAQTLDRPPNGHGRRSHPRRFALPRMSHTAVRPHAGTFEEVVSEVKRGLCVGYLTPRRIDLLSGDFSFLCPEARWIEDGRLGPFVQPLLVEGNGLEALRGLERVGADFATFFGLKGCGKLDQGGLPVSFGNPTLRISRLHVRPAP